MGRNRQQPQPSKNKKTIYVVIFGLALIVGFFILISGNSTPSPTPKRRVLPNYPLVVLYHGKPEEAPYEWNTGVWPAWGEHSGNMYNRSIVQRLRWQAAGAKITKTCNVSCYITHDQSLVPRADAVVMELINHYKFYGSDTNLPIPWPEKPKLSHGRKQYWGLFQYESIQEYDYMMYNQTLMDQFDFKMVPSRKFADMPVGLVCNWGLSNNQFLQSSMTTHSPQPGQALIADFRGVITPGYEHYFATLNQLLDIDFYGGPYANKHDDSEYILYNRIELMSKYMFIIIAESIVEDDWICPEYSQALLSGAIPIYIGAPNIEYYLPGKNAIVNIRDFSTPEKLAAYLQQSLTEASVYERHHAWKAHGLTPQFKEHLGNCAHMAECRICNKVMELNGF